ncbi:MAG: DUF523 domain-containing protein [Candidatus Cloacimonetes bacterium]|nr:DUF523 domain-containing protein [Candidatus Cloacimonadota bacterium]
MEKILISACLAGMNCKYDGGNNLHPEIIKLVESGAAILICPEQMGGLPTPRLPAEIIGDSVFNNIGEDVTAQFAKGATETLRLAKLYGITKAILKERSPSCGVHYIYDGTFSGTKIKGSGLTCLLLQAHGIKISSEEEL